jgi:hypothetical protein
MMRQPMAMVGRRQMATARKKKKPMFGGYGGGFR